jgi:hypothetical protein
VSSNERNTGRTISRFAALIGGVGILTVGAIVTLGMMLFAPLGFWAVYRWQRSRHRPFDAWGGWVGSVSGVIGVLLVVAGVASSRVSSNTWAQMRKTADSASAESEQKPLPGWVTSIQPSANRYRFRQPPVINHAMMMWGFAMFIGMFGGFLGTIGWCGASLLVFYRTGRWFKERPLESMVPT